MNSDLSPNSRKRETSDKTFFALGPSTGKEPLHVFKGLSPIVDRIVFTASSSEVLVCVVILF